MVYALFVEFLRVFDGAVAFGVFEGEDDIPAVGREERRDRLVAGPHERHHDLGLGRHVVLDGDAGLGERGVFEYLEDVAVVGDHAREPAFGDAQHVEQRLGLVEVGDRCREYRAQRIAHLARPLLLRADDDQFVGGALCGFEPRIGQCPECLATCHRCDDGRGQRDTEDSFHSRSGIESTTNIVIFFGIVRNFTIFAWNKQPCV